jgi:hypothetical protein
VQFRQDFFGRFLSQLMSAHGCRNSVRDFSVAKDLTKDDIVHLSIYRARTTSFFVQLCTCRQCGQVNLWFLTLAAAHNSSLMV